MRPGQAIVAVRGDRGTARRVAIHAPHIQAMTFAIGALMAGAAGRLIAVKPPCSSGLGGDLLGKAFIVCVLGEPEPPRC